jgi:hypothetical protein
VYALPPNSIGHKTGTDIVVAANTAVPSEFRDMNTVLVPEFRLILELELPSRTSTPSTL